MFFNDSNGNTHSGDRCPKCLSGDIEAYNDAAPDQRTILWYMRCCICLYKWADVFKLQGYLEDPDND